MGMASERSPLFKMRAAAGLFREFLVFSNSQRLGYVSTALPNSVNRGGVTSKIWASPNSRFLISGPKQVELEHGESVSTCHVCCEDW